MQSKWNTIWIILALVMAACAPTNPTPEPDFTGSSEMPVDANLIIQAQFSEDFEYIIFTMNDEGRGGIYLLGDSEFVNNEFKGDAPLFFSKNPDIFPTRDGMTCVMIENIDEPLDQEIEWIGKYSCP